MVDQAEVRPANRVFPGAPDEDRPRAEAGDLLHDVVALAELQGQLFAENAQGAVRQAKALAVAMGAAMTLGIAGMPILLAALGLALSLTGLPLWASMLVIAVLALGGASVLAWAAARGVARLNDAFKPSWNELQANLAWFKRAIRRQYPQRRAQ